MSHPQRAKRNLLPGKPAPASKADLAALRKEMRATTEALSLLAAQGPTPTIPEHLVEAALNAFVDETSAIIGSGRKTSNAEARMGDEHATSFSFNPLLAAASTPEKAEALGGGSPTNRYLYTHHNTLKAGIEAVLRVLWEGEQKERANDQG